MVSVREVVSAGAVSVNPFPRLLMYTPLGSVALASGVPSLQLNVLGSLLYVHTGPDPATA